MPNGASLHLTYLHDHLSLQTPLRALMIDRAKPMLSRIGSRFGIQGGGSCMGSALSPCTQVFYYSLNVLAPIIVGPVVL